MYVPLREGGGGVNRYSIIPDFGSTGDHSLKRDHVPKTLFLKAGTSGISKIT